jgi:hypothetical protein
LILAAAPSSPTGFAPRAPKQLDAATNTPELSCRIDAASDTDFTFVASWTPRSAGDADNVPQVLKFSTTNAVDLAPDWAKNGRKFAGSSLIIGPLQRERADRVVLGVLNTSVGDCSVQLPAVARPRFETQWSRTNEAGALLTERFAHRTENRHGRSDAIASSTDRLTDARGRIYKVDYSCEGAACGWSYNPRAELGYAGSTAISADGKAFQWTRRWDGDPTLDIYTAFYELPHEVCVENCGNMK